jgi:hypothetical protein
MLAGFEGIADGAQMDASNDAFHFATVSLYAADDSSVTDETELLPVIEEQAPGMAGDTYYVYGHESACRCRYPGFYVGAEATVLRPFVGGSCLDTPCFLERAREISEKVQPDFQMYAAPRLWLGYTSCSGLGCRVRWWRMDLQASDQIEFTDLGGGQFAETFRGEISASLDAQTIDFEVTDDLFLGQKWDLVVSGGLRYARFDWTSAQDGELSSSFDGVREYRKGSGREFEGLGGTAAVELYRPWFRRVGLFANLRGSVMYGERGGLFVEQDPARDVDIYEQGDTGGVVTSIWEAQLGVDWTREVGHGMYLTGRVAGEVQYWDSMLFNNTDIGFAGMTFAVGLIR